MKKFYDTRQFLEGRKSYIVAVITALVNLAVAFGWISVTQDQLDTINTVLVALFGVTISAKINRAL